MPSTNFGFLGVHDAQLVKLGGQAEQYFRDDPATALIKLRQFAELLSKTVAACNAVYLGETFEETLRRLSFERIIPKEIADVFHALRKVGNKAVHNGEGTHSDALSALKFARQLGIWFHRAYGKKPDFKPGPFLPPREPVDATAALTKEIEELRKRIAESEDAAGRARREAEEHARARETAEERWKREAEERAIWEQLAQETEAEKARLMTHGSALRSLPLESAEAAHLDALQAAAAQAPKSDILELIARGEEAATKIDLDEADTRALIDQQLRDSGWEVDTQSLRHSNSTRPVKGRNLAIAEWPTASGPADYALFVGLTLVGVVEGKRRRKNVRPASQLKEFAANLSASAAAFLNIYLRRPSSSRHELNAVPSCNGFGITLSSGSCPPPEKYFLFDDGGV